MSEEADKNHALTERIIKRLRGSDERRGVSIASISASIGIVVALVGLGGVILDAGAQKEKVQQLEKREAETKQLIENKVKDLKADLNKTDTKVDKILETLGEIKGELRTDRRERQR